MADTSTNGNGNGHSNGAPTANAEAERRFSRFQDIVANALMSRRELMNRLLDPRRDINSECGFPVSPVVSGFYQDLYDREPIPARVVEVMAKECWQVQPSVYEKEKGDTATAFEEAWDELSRQLHGEQSWYQDEHGAMVWEYLRRADILSGVGQYGVILLGLDDIENDNMAAEAAPRAGMKLKYIRVFPESMAQITRFDGDLNSPRFGQPVEYTITFNDPRSSTGGIGLTTATKAVHWSRVIHVADTSHQAGTSEVFAVPRMQSVLNNLLGLRKLYAGSPEMYWRGAFPGYSLETHPQLGGDVEVDPSATRDMMEDYMNGLQRYLMVMGMSVKTLSPQVVDPTPQISVQVEAICIKIGCPVRVFKGSERGELASSQDDDAWNDRLKERQWGYLSPRLVAPLVNRLIYLKVLPTPKGFSISWPDLKSQSEAEKATVANTRTTALVQYIGGGGESLIQPFDFLTRFLGMEDEEATTVLENSKAVLEQDTPADAGGSPLLGMVGGVSAVMEMFGQFKAGAIGEETLKQLLMLFFKLDEKRAEEIIADGLPEPPAPPPGSILPPPPPGTPGVPPKPGFPPVKGTIPPVKGTIPPNKPVPGKPAPAANRGTGMYPTNASWEPLPFSADLGGWEVVANAFCPTGPGGGIDPSCSPGGAGAGKGKGAGGRVRAKRGQGVAKEKHAPPPPGEAYTPDVTKTGGKDGVAEASRVGVKAFDVPPPPPIGKLPNLTPEERQVEHDFIRTFEQDPDGVAKQFNGFVKQTTKPGNPPTFGTDDAKALTDVWSHPDVEVRSQNRASFNTALHQTANAIAKRAFLQELDTLKEGDAVLVTVGGCGAGKGYALNNVPEAMAMKAQAKVVWDSAGDQNATENPWIQHEAERRGLKVNYVYVHADPKKNWADPERGVIKRASDPNDGRMVDAKVFADSYALGARNHQNFYAANADNPNASFVFLENVTKPKLIDGIPKAALKLNRKTLTKFALREVEKSNAPPHIKRGATIGTRIWGD